MLLCQAVRRSFSLQVIAVNTRHKCSLSLVVSHPKKLFISGSGSRNSIYHQKQSFSFHSVRSLSSSVLSRMGPIRNKDGEEEEPSKIIDNAIADHSVVIFSKSFCPFCTKIKDFFAAKGIPFTAFELDTMGKQGAEIQSSLLEKTGHSTVPSVWVKGKFIGKIFEFIEQLRSYLFKLLLLMFLL